MLKSGPRLVLHVGPGKCGSTSIQQYFLHQPNPCRGSVRFILLDPNQISALNRDDPDKQHIETLKSQLLEWFDKCDNLILSHEALFQSPAALRQLCLHSRDRVSEIRVVGYSRKQSAFIKSAYSQWHFRSPERVAETVNVLKKSGVQPFLFTGLERHLIAAINSDFHTARQLSNYTIHNWFPAYKQLEKYVEGLNVEIKCGTLPDKQSRTGLIEDFCKKAGLKMKLFKKIRDEKILNASFNDELVEAINVAVLSGASMPGPHEKNNQLSRLSSLMEPGEKLSTDFISELYSYIDSYYYEDNMNLCRQFELEPSCFGSLKPVSKNEILEIIQTESARRSNDLNDVFERHQKMSAVMMSTTLRLVDELK